MEAFVAEVREDIVTHYSKRFYQNSNLLLLEPYQCALILVGYGLLCSWGLRKAETKAKPILTDGKVALRIYNIFQVVFSGYIAYMCTTTYLVTAITTGDVCQSMHSEAYSDDAYVSTQMVTCYLFYLSKLVDITDTVFIIVRGKWRQLTFLHMFHHTSVIFLAWLPAYYHPCGFNHISIQLNAPMHFFMYFYYFLSSFPSLAPHLWWKKYITSLQLLQFYVGTGLACFCFLRRLVMGEEATGLSLIYTITVSFYGAFLMLLFQAFYKVTYNPAAKKSN